MTTENKRDLNADLLICAAVPGVYYDEGGGYTAISLTEAAARFFEEAPFAWPEAIRRAIVAEAENERLAAEVLVWRKEALRQYPTPEAYDAACAALHKHRDRADTAETKLERLRTGITVAITYSGGIIVEMLRNLLTEVSADDTTQESAA